MIPYELLRRFPFFSFMNDEELQAVARIAQELHLDAGEVVIESNTPADALYFQVDGHMPYYMLAITEHLPDFQQEYFIGYITPGEVFGISALLEPYQYTARMRADSPCRVIQIDASALRALCAEDAHLSVGLMQAIAKAAMERLQMTRIQLVTEMLKASALHAN